MVVGDGDGLEACRALARELGIGDQVRFEGYKTNVPLYLAAMDLFLFPSHKEAMGIALVEAMALSLPCIAANVDGIPEVLTESSGVLVPVREPEAIASQARKLLASPPRMSAMGQAARSRVEEVFSAAAMERNTERVYLRLLGTPQTLGTEEALPVGTPA
jgi:glycosyltransferase involved in cell wall biosynthesis